jgi:hypothetical protein
MITESINNCQNCNNPIEVNFCSNYGQKKYKRIDKKYIWDEVQYTTIHTNKGFLYSIKKILKNPGKAAKEFIEGNRVNHYKPIALAFILSGISGFISYKIIHLNDLMNDYSASKNLNSDFMNDYMSLVTSYNSIFMLLFIPIMAIFTTIAFRKWGQNYYEHIVMNAFGLSFYTLTSILILFPILFVFRKNMENVLQITSYSMMLIPIIMVWFYKNFYDHQSLKNIILRVLLVFVFFFIAYIIIVIGLIAIYVVIKGPEALQFIKPK